MMQFSMEATLSRWTAEQDHHVGESELQWNMVVMSWQLAVSPELARLLGVQRCCTSTGRRGKMDSLVSVISGFGFGKAQKIKPQGQAVNEDRSNIADSQHNHQSTVAVVNA